MQKDWQAYFPRLVSYNRFVEWLPSTLIPLVAYLRSHFGACSGISFMDSTSLRVCHNKRIHQHQVFQNLATRGKTSVDWFFGFKLHLVVNDKGELLNFQVTPGNVDDRKPVPKLLQQLFGKVYADKGYISLKLAKDLVDSVGIQLITKQRAQHEATFDAPRRSTTLAETCGDRNHYRPIEKYFPNRAFSTSFSGQLLCEHPLWIDRLLPSTQKARYCYHS